MDAIPYSISVIGQFSPVSTAGTVLHGSDGHAHGRTFSGIAGGGLADFRRFSALVVAFVAPAIAARPKIVPAAAAGGRRYTELFPDGDIIVTTT